MKIYARQTEAIIEMNAKKTQEAVLRVAVNSVSLHRENEQVESEAKFYFSK